MCQRCLVGWKETFPMSIFHLILITFLFALLITCRGGESDRGATATASINPLEVFMPPAGFIVG